ncbi:MAG TPA: phage holin family protein [Thermomicrobiales bacterium]|nr:phage holin family protein [Thermomicrobiales bacterium]
MAEHTAGQRDPRSIAEITNDLLSNAQEVLRDEVRLAKVEITDELKSAARATAMLAAGVVMALFAFGMLLFAITWALDSWLPQWAAALIVAAAVALIATVLIVIGKNRVSEINPKPEETVETMKENVQWVKQPTQSGMTSKTGVSR